MEQATSSRRMAPRMIGAAALAALLAAAGPAAAQSPSDPVKLGGLGPVTGKGAIIGAALQAAVKLATQEMNQAGGILHRPVVLVLGDTQTDPTISAGEAKRLAYQEKIQFLVGPTNSQETVPAAMVMTEAKVMQITTAGTLDLPPTVAPYHFSSAASAEAQGVAMVDYALDKAHAAAPAILSDDGGQSKSGVAAILRHLQERNAKLAGQQQFAFRTDDMTPQLLSLRQAKADLILFFLSEPGDLELMLKTLGDINWDVTVVSMSSVTTYASFVAKTVGSKAFEHVVAAAYPGYTYCPADPVGQSAYPQFVAKLKAFDPNTATHSPTGTAFYYYDAAYILKSVAEQTGTTDGPTNSAWLVANGPKLKDGVATLTPTDSSHFLVGPSSLIMVEQPDQVRSDGLIKRAGC